MSDRLLSFDAIENFRDFGGYATPDGMVKRGQLFRSAQMSRPSDTDLKRLADLDLRMVLDLRRASERAKQPDRLPDGWQGRHVSSDLGGDGEAPHIRFLKSEVLTEDSGRRYLTHAYLHMAFEPAHVALFKDYFAGLNEGASLIHCAAGKDRTGLLASLVHVALGVGEDDMMADYLATNAAVNLEGRADEMARKLEKLVGQPVSRGSVVAFLGVEPDFLHTAHRAIREQHGSLMTYLDRVLGVDAAAISRLRESLCG